MKFRSRFRPFLQYLAVLAAPIAVASPAAAQVYTQAGFETYLQQVAAKARAEGVSERAISAGLSGLTINQRVVELDRPQAYDPNSIPPPFAPYRRDHVDAARISGGQRTYAANASIIPRVEARYGVPGEILVAIWGHETNYGSFMGGFDTIRSLATLAYEGRRRDLFEGELIAALKMIDRGVARSQLTGSWAGAIGNPQFLPSVWLRVAQDGDGNGTRDIWNSRADTLHSIAAYFRDAGWRPGEPWGVPAYVPSGFNRDAVKTDLVSPRCPRVFARHSQWRTIREWKALGIRPQKIVSDDVMAILFEPDGPGQTAYLLTGNYRVILDYNCSNYYALSVGILADEIRR
ncbi:lytic murein transglycosylase [Croceicoccus naphthovorans]|uniref:Lytic transglycosylase n=1 Tax=Croceicoccus naphthovorans TaxID=1348774 RepID=A0A0G3XKE8_9SPHN|nr:lytic murein transglycosylase [Croceicoccus naphthovorans]AKM11682.1 lytic transglycosylase [Croceicoccus naphthovorans]MBB3991244.1 lytic murein transglycosylase [Croceicoccus naphthovorans]